MENTNILYKVKNRSSGKVTYSVTYNGNKMHQVYNPGETKVVPYEELRQLSYQHGGPELIYNYLQITKEEVLKELNIDPEPEYYMSEKEIQALLQTGTMDAFLDCLDFAPIGVIDLIKKYAVELPLNDFNKRKAIREKLGFDVDAAIKNNEASKEEVKSNEAPARRVVEKKEDAESKAPARRTTPKYNIVNKQQ